MTITINDGNIEPKKPEVAKTEIIPPKPAPNAPTVPAAPVAVETEEKKADLKATTQAALDARQKAEAARQPALTRQQQLADLCEQRFLRVSEMPGANFSHKGSCAKCGWQTMQHTKEDAHAMTRQHVMTHWKDVAAQVKEAA